MESKTITFTTTDTCKHKNGWYQKIHFKTWLITFEKVMFICKDCNRAVDKD